MEVPPLRGSEYALPMGGYQRAAASRLVSLPKPPLLPLGPGIHLALQHHQGQGAVLQQGIVEGAELELRPQLLLVFGPQLPDFQLPIL